MTTKIALLPRLLPGLFGRAAAVSSAGYRMPHERFFFYGIGLSAAVHVAVLFGVRPSPIVTPPTLVEEKPVPPDIWRRLETEPVDVEKPDIAEKEKPETSPEDSTAVEAPATLPECFGDPRDRDIEITITKIPPGVVADPNRKSWKVPDGPAAGARVRTDTRLRPEDLDEVPVVTSRVSPRYPAEAKRLGLGGKAVLRFIVDARGNVAEVEVVRADYAEFGKAATEALLKWKFKPGIKNRRRVDTIMEIPMSFALEKSA